MSDIIAFNEMSKRSDGIEKRVDSNEKDIEKLRDANHSRVTELTEARVAIIEIDGTMTSVAENQRTIREDMRVLREAQIQTDKRLKVVEEIAEPAKLILKNRKTIFWVFFWTIVISAIIGLSLGNDGKDLLSYAKATIAKKVTS